MKRRHLNHKTCLESVWELMNVWRVIRLQWFLSCFIGMVIFIIFSNWIGLDYGPSQGVRIASLSAITKWLSLDAQATRRLFATTSVPPHLEPMPRLDARHVSNVVKTIDEYISSFVDKLVNIRTIHLKNLHKNWWETLPETTELIDADSMRFLTQIRNIKALQTITINISFDEFLTKFPWIGYNYGGSDCGLMESKSEYGNNAPTYNSGYGLRYYKTSCQRNITSLIKQIPFERSVLDIGYLPFLRPRKEEPGEIAALSYLHIAQNAIATLDGDVFVGQYKLSPQRCMPAKHTGGKPIEEMALYEEVFTIAQFWGEGFFHFMNEELPRLAAWVIFLKRYPGVKIHVHSQHAFINTAFTSLGLSPSRIIDGNVRAQLLYSPAGTSCGSQSYFNSKLLSLRLQENISSNPPTIHLRFNVNKINQSLPLPSSSQTLQEVAAPANIKVAAPANIKVAAPVKVGNLKPSSRNYIVLIKRSTKRFFMHHEDVFHELVKLADERGLHVVVFDDTQLPPYKDIVEMFHGAVAIVGPHGAGFSNMFYAQPGTIIIEGLCYNNGVANLCYRNLAKLIGHRYYGVMLTEDCLYIKPTDIVTPLRKFLDLLNIGEIKTKFV